MSYTDGLDRESLRKTILAAEQDGDINVQVPTAMLWRFLQDAEWVAGQSDLIQKLNERLAELEARYVETVDEYTNFRDEAAQVRKDRDRLKGEEDHLLTRLATKEAMYQKVLGNVLLLKQRIDALTNALQRLLESPEAKDLEGSAQLLKARELLVESPE